MMGNLLSTVYDDRCMYLQNCYRLLELGEKSGLDLQSFYPVSPRDTMSALSVPIMTQVE